MSNEAKFVGIGKNDSDQKQGSPKTLNQAIRHGLMIGPLVTIDENIENHVRDFLSQRFQVSLLQAAAHSNKKIGAEIESTLVTLFDSIIKK